MNNSEQDKAPPGQNKTVVIFVNGREMTVPKGKIKYEEVVALAYPNPDFENNTYKVTFFRKNDHHEGSLTKGQLVEVIDGMSFTVIRAVRS